MPLTTGRATKALAGVALATVLTATGCSSESETGAIKVGIVCGGLSLAALTIDEGHLGATKAEQICFDSGSDAVQALSGGSIDAFVGAGEIGRASCRERV